VSGSDRILALNRSKRVFLRRQLRVVADKSVECQYPVATANGSVIDFSALGEHLMKYAIVIVLFVTSSLAFAQNS
jgi:hypothetical protein